jgi:hypothetical protein
MVVTAGSVAYYALKVEQYLEVPEGYAVCEIHNYEALLGYEMVIKRIYEIGKPWKVELIDVIDDALMSYSFHVSAFYLDKEKTVPATKDTFESFPADGITLYLEKAPDISGNYISEEDGSLLKVDATSFILISGTEETTYPFQKKYYLGSYYVLVNESDEVVATFSFTFSNLDNIIHLRFEGQSKEIVFKKQ